MNCLAIHQENTNVNFKASWALKQLGIWKYMASHGPFSSREEFKEYLQKLEVEPGSKIWVK